MNLTTHWIFALALGIAIFRNVEIALIMSIGALIPDLDREYLFVAKSFIGKHQLHRALFHNFFLIGVIYFVNPFLALGALSHSLLDMFTSATDRGAEVLFSDYANSEGIPFHDSRRTANLVKGYTQLVGRRSVDSARKDFGQRPAGAYAAGMEKILRPIQEQPGRRLGNIFRISGVSTPDIF